MLDSIQTLLFRCPHRRCTFPRRPAVKFGEPQGDTYVVCLDCGKPLHYDWKRMRVGAPVARKPGIGSEAPRGAANSGPKLVSYIRAVCALPFTWLSGRTAPARENAEPENRKSNG